MCVVAINLEKKYGNLIKTYLVQSGRISRKLNPVVLVRSLRLRIRSERFAEEGAASRTVAREAIGRLVAIGLLEGRNGKGLVVRRPDPLRPPESANAIRDHGSPASMMSFQNRSWLICPEPDQEVAA